MAVPITCIRKRFVLLGIALLLVFYTAQRTQLLQRVRLQVLEWQNVLEWQKHALWLPDYVATLQGVPIVGLDSDVSALTYDRDRHRLIGVTNQQPHLFELSLTGQLLRKIPLVGFSDPESIVYVGPNAYIIADERRQRLIKVVLSDTSTAVDAVQGEQLTLGMGHTGNKGFEGLAYDVTGKRLFVAQERDPVRILEIQGFPIDSGSARFGLHVHNDEGRNQRLAVRDLSGLQYDARHGHLLVLSDESRLVLELNPQGQPIGGLSLRAGRHGLQKDVPQAEGITLDDAGNLYLVSEPNLFYRFEKNSPP